MIALSILSGTPCVAVDPRALPCLLGRMPFLEVYEACVEVLPLREGREARTLDMMGIVCPLPGMKPHWVLGIAPGVLSMCLSSRSAKMRSKVLPRWLVEGDSSVVVAVAGSPDLYGMVMTTSFHS
jgi:hypothetical protein